MAETLAGAAGRVTFALATRATESDRARALPCRLAFELFEQWCPGRPSARTLASVAGLGVALGGSMSDDTAALRERVRVALREGRVLALRDGRAEFRAAAAPRQETEVVAPVVREALEDIRIVAVDDRTSRLLPGIKLTIAPASGAPHRKTTDGEGAVELRDLRPGPCHVGAVFDGATLRTCYEVVAIESGQAPTATEAEPHDDGHEERTYALSLKRHKVSTGETLQSVADAYGTTWKQLAKFNFGSTAPRDVNRALRHQVGCRQKTADGANYVFNSDDAPGILFIPGPWERSGLSTDRTYTLRLRVPGVERVRPFIFSM